MRSPKSKAASGSPEIYSVWSDEVAQGRLDAKYWLPSIRELLRAVQNGKYKSRKLGEFITEIHYGVSTTNEYVDGGIPLLRILNLKNDGLDISDVVYLSEEHRDEIGRAFVKENDLLISRSGSVGIVVVVPKEADGYAFGSFMIKFRLNVEIDRQYVAAWMNSVAGRKLVEREKIGAIQGNITIETIRNFDIPVPPLKVQKEVVKKVWEAYDRKHAIEAEIKKVLASIDGYVLGELGIGAMGGPATSRPSEVFTVWSDETADGRLDAEYYRPSFKEFYKKLVAGKYEVAEIEQLATDVFQGVGKDETEDPAFTLLKVKNVLKNNEIDFEDVEFVRDVPANKVLRPNDVLSPFIGQAVRQCKFSVFDSEGDKHYTVDNNTGVIRLKEDVADSGYVTTVLGSIIGRIQLEHRIGGGGVPFLGAANAKKIRVPLPPLDIQKKIAQAVDKQRERVRQLRHDAEGIIVKAQEQTADMILA